MPRGMLSRSSDTEDGFSDGFEEDVLSESDGVGVLSEELAGGVTLHEANVKQSKNVSKLRKIFFINAICPFYK